MSYDNGKLQSNFPEDFFFGDSDLNQFKDKEWPGLGLLDSNFADTYVGLSPSHSSDSGVDILTDDVFCINNISLAGKGQAKISLLSDSFLADDLYTTSLDKVDVMESGQIIKNGQIFKNGKFIKSAVLQSDDPTIEDHCYTNKKSFQTAEKSVLNPLGAIHAKRKSNADENVELDATSLYSNDLESVDGGGNESEKCNNRNAVMARLNRQRKKRYVENLESEVSFLRKQNKHLASDNEDMKSKLDNCAEKITYLQNILANESMLSSVINAVSSAPGVNLSGTVKLKHGSDRHTGSESVSKAQNITCNKSELAPYGNKSSLNQSINANKRQICKESGAGKAKQGRYDGGTNSTAGICLHVNQENVSIELCHHCSSHAMAIKNDAEL